MVILNFEPPNISQKTPGIRADTSPKPHSLLVCEIWAAVPAEQRSARSILSQEFTAFSRDRRTAEMNEHASSVLLGKVRLAHTHTHTLDCRLLTWLHAYTQDYMLRCGLTNFSDLVGVYNSYEPVSVNSKRQNGGLLQGRNSSHLKTLPIYFGLLSCSDTPTVFMSLACCIL